MLRRRRTELIEGWVRNASVVTLLACFLVQRVSASGTDPSWYRSHTYRDLDGDGKPDLMLIAASFATDNDQIWVYDRNGDMQAMDDWSSSADFEDDLWLFDAGSDGQIELALDFQRSDRGLVANLYDNLAQRPFSPNASVEVVEQNLLRGGTITARVRAPDGWWFRDGKVNYNLELEIDGAVVALFDTPASALKTDGSVDVRIRVRDANSDGVPDYEIREFSSPWPTRNYAQVWISVNESLGEPPVRDALAWPYLCAGNHNFLQKPGEIYSPVQMDWQSGKIATVAEFIPSHALENSWYIQSFVPVKEGETAALDFENPMAYYDLAADKDGRPELHIRLEHFPVYDHYLEVGPSPAPQNDVRYSWNQDNSPDLVWDYKVGLAGRNPVTSAIRVDDLSVESVPYAALPKWVSDQTWEWGTFIAREGRGSPSSEGIYEWAAVDAVQTDPGNPDGIISESQLQLRGYLHGLSTTTPERFYQEIGRGLRGEFGYLQDRPYLYMSPIDAKLHLRKATQGVWNVGDGTEIRYADRDGDSYLDQWQYFEGRQLHGQLNVLADHLIYFSPISKTLQLKVARVAPSLFETLPPKDHAEWLALGEQLAQYRRDFAPGDFASIAAQFAGPTTEILGAAARDLRAAPRGFRFVLDLQPEFSMPLDQTNLAPLLGAPGSYVVAYDGKAWSARPATPVSLRVSNLRVATRGGALQALGWTTVEAAVRNDGLEDAHGLPVCATFDGPEGRRSVMTDTLTLLPGEGQQRVAWDWAPPAAGSWVIRVAADCSGSEEDAPGGQALGKTTVTVSDSAQPSAGWLISLGGRVPGSIAVFLFVTVALAGVAAAAWAKESGA